MRRGPGPAGRSRHREHSERCEGRGSLHPGAALPHRPVEAGDRDHSHHLGERLRARRRAVGLGERLRPPRRRPADQPAGRRRDRALGPGRRHAARSTDGQGRRPELGQRLRPVYRPLHPRARAEGRPAGRHRQGQLRLDRAARGRLLGHDRADLHRRQRADRDRRRHHRRSPVARRRQRLPERRPGEGQLPHRDHVARRRQVGAVDDGTHRSARRPPGRQADARVQGRG